VAVERERGLRPVHGLARAAVVASHLDAPEITGRALLQIELRPLAGAALAIEVREGDPREVAEVAALARGDEGHGDGVVRRVLAALRAVAAVLALELIMRARETAAALADEPARKLERADADARERSAHVAFGRLAEVVALREVEVGVQCLEARDERAAQARIVERFAVVVLAVAPVLEPADDDGTIDQVDHRPRPEGRDELALPELPFGSRDALLLLEAGH